MQAGKPLDKMRDYSLRNDLGARVWDVFCTANFLNFMPSEVSCSGTPPSIETR